MQNKQIQGPAGTETINVLFSFPFRIFFLLAATYAAVLIPVWLCILFLGRPDIAPIPIVIWHAHEVVYGVVAAAIAGFMLTAICTWTGCQPLTGYRLGAFVLVWLLGRLVMLFPGFLPLVWVALVDLLFLSMLLVYVSVILVRSRNWRNLPMSVLLLLLLLANLQIQWGIVYTDIVTVNAGKTLSLIILMLMLAFIGGRIIPAFTGNWLARTGVDKAIVKSNKFLDITCILLIVIIIPVELFSVATPFKAFVPIVASFFLLIRLLGWKGWLCRKEPLLWVLHVAYLWLVLAIFFKGLSHLSTAITASVWVHMLGLGAIGTMILGVMTRVALGHTGRQLSLPRWSVASYYLISLAAFCRLLYGLGIHTDSMVLTATGLAWSAAFIVFLFTYWPILTGKRVDNQGQNL